jgi:putative SOS response-associated peptidase YedK
VRALHVPTYLARACEIVPADAQRACTQHSAPLQHLPTTNIDAVIERDGRRELSTMRWGLIPSWWSKPLKEMKVATFNNNACAETVASKPVFRDAFSRTRCLIPASGYYEWQDTPGGEQPYYFTRRDGQPITIAGLWDAWRDKQAGETVKSCAMVITDAIE